MYDIEASNSKRGALRIVLTIVIFTIVIGFGAFIASTSARTNRSPEDCERTNTNIGGVPDGYRADPSKAIRELGEILDASAGVAKRIEETILLQSNSDNSSSGDDWSSTSRNSEGLISSDTLTDQRDNESVEADRLLE